MSSYLFVLGRTPDLSFQEISALFQNPIRVSYYLASAELHTGAIPENVIKRLGGTVKIAEIVAHIHSLTAQDLIPLLPHRDQLVFGLSLYGNLSLPDGLLRAVKDAVNHLGRKVSYVVAKNQNFLDSVVVAKKHVYELIVYPENDVLAIARTVAVQPFEAWSNRDFGRPNADPKRGMLPPKVARMILNITLTGKQNLTVLDPFCGMGTIVAEAILMGQNTIAADYSPEAVRYAEENIRWLQDRYKSDRLGRCRFLVSNAVRIADVLSEGSVDAVVTEPFMGKADQTTDPQTIRNRVKGLEKLYIGCLKNWYTLLREQGAILIAFPSIRLGKKEISVKKPIDMCENLGYTKVLGPIEYAREGASVIRHFYKFIKK